MDGLTISQLADTAGVKVSTVRFYERSGLVGEPTRSASGYRLYGADDQRRLLLVARARRLGLSIEQIGRLVEAWQPSSCATSRASVTAMLDDNLAEIRARLAELRAFEAELVRARAALADGPDTCEPGLACCAPEVAVAAPGSLRAVKAAR